MAMLPRREQMGDATVVAWVLRRLSLARRFQRSAEIEEIRALLALPQVAGRVFDGDERLAASLLAELPDHLVSLLAGRLIRCWPGLPDPVAAQAVIRLAGLHAPGVVAMVLPHVDSLQHGCTDVRLSGVLSAAGAAGECGGELLDAVENALGQRLGPFRMFHAGYLRARLRLDRPGTASWLARLLQADDFAGGEADAAVAQAYSELAPGSPMLSLVVDVDERGFGYRFSDLPELFAHGAPLDDLDALAFQGRGIHLKAALRLLEQSCPPPGLARFARELADSLSTDCCGFGRRGAYRLLVAAAAEGFAATEHDFSGKSLQELLDLYCCDVSDLPCASALEAAIRARVSAGSGPVLLNELAVCAPFRGGGRMVKLVADLLPEPILRPLVDCLGEECEGQAAAVAAVELARRSPATLDWLVLEFPELDFCQRMRALEVIAVASHPRSAACLASLLPRVRNDPFELALWCDAAGSLGDPSLLAGLPQTGPPELDDLRLVLEALARDPFDVCRKRALQGSNL